MPYQVRLGFIAMSGVRAQNPELTSFGLTLPGFIERSRTIASMPSLGLLTLAGLTPSCVEMRYLDFPDLSKINGVPEEFDVVAISSFTAQIKDAYALADRYRRMGTKVVLGGLHVTALPEEAIKHADAIVLGEGEIAWPQVISDLMHAGKALRAVYDARGISFNFNNSPVPRYDLLDVEQYNRLTIQTQRGCPFQCEFCAASIQISPVYKVKPIELVEAELRFIKSVWAKPFIEFADDNTFVNKEHSKKLLRALRSHNIRWFTETDLSIADDPELLVLMVESGCAQVLIGFESTTVEGLDGLEQKSNWKAKQLARYLQCIDRIQSHGISVNGCFILGLDGTGPESFEQIWRFVRESGLHEVQITVQTAFPGTPLYRRLRAEGRLLDESAWERCTLFDVNFQPANMTVSQLETGLRELAERLYSEDSTRQRRADFYEKARSHTKRRSGGSPIDQGYLPPG